MKRFLALLCLFALVFVIPKTHDACCPPAVAENPASAGTVEAAVGTAEVAAGTVEIPVVKTIVYYFYTAARCASCHKIENWAKAAVEAAFAAELASGAMEWRPVNIEEPGNAHFVEDFQLYTKSVVVERLVGDKREKWKNLDQVWMLLRDEAKYREYVVAQIKALL